MDRPPRPPERAAAARPRPARAATPPRTRRMPAGPRRGLRRDVPRALPRRLHRGRGGRAARGAGLPDLRRRARAGADRRRDRPLARGGPVGRGGSADRRHLRLRRDARRLRAARRARPGGGSSRPLRLRDHRRRPRGRRRASRTCARTRSSPSASRCPRRTVLLPELNRVLFALIDERLEVFDDAITAVAELRARGVPIAVASSSVRERLDRTLAHAGLRVRDHDRGRRGRARQAGAGHVPARRRAARRCRPRRCVVVEDSPPGVAAGLRRGDADARRPPRPRASTSRAATRVVDAVTADGPRFIGSCYLSTGGDAYQ